jgi:hypothetical protein
MLVVFRVLLELALEEQAVSTAALRRSSAGRAAASADRRSEGVWEEV